MINIDGVLYKKVEVEHANEKRYVIARTYSAGVFAGYLESQNGKHIVLSSARRLWYWSGACSLSELSVRGVKNPDECKFPCEVPRVELFECIELLDVSPEAKKSIASVSEWKSH